MSSYGWHMHDGRNYGLQKILDKPNNITISTEFLKVPGGKNGGDWVVRVHGNPAKNQESYVNVMFYITNDGAGSLHLRNKYDSKGYSEPVVINGTSPALGDFAFVIVDGPNNEPPVEADPDRPDLPDLERTHVTAAFMPKGSTWKVKDEIQSVLLSQAQTLVKTYGNPLPHVAHLFTMPDVTNSDPNIFIVQKTLKAPFQFDVVFLSKSARSHSNPLSEADARPLHGDSLTKLFDDASETFRNRFEKTFKLTEKGFTPAQIKFAQAIMSNMLGGLGYFHGTSIVDRALEGYDEDEPTDYIDADEEDDDDYFDDGLPRRAKPQPNPQLEGPTTLFTAVPSRPFFPRGFLWDEGFHQLLVGTWDNDLSLDVISHWASLIDGNGWVAREQILGEEARSKVPAEFQTQYPHYANPPTLVLALLKFLERSSANQQIDPLKIQDSMSSDILTTDDPMFITKQFLADHSQTLRYLKSVYPHFKRQYEWFRKTQWGDIKGYPGRKSRSSEAYRWRGRVDQHTLTSGLDDYPRASPPHPGELHVDLIAWVGLMAKSLAKIAQELGENSDIQMYEKHLEGILMSLEDLHWNPASKSFCDVTVDTNGKSVFVVHKGFLSLFPLLLGLLPADSDRLEAILELMHDPAHLWTPYGLASLSKSDPYFGTNENYWRGPIWININYLALSSLYKNYINVEGPYQEKAKTIYKELRQNIIDNVYKQYRATGYVWEQYSAIDGKGKRSHPFTGWTALVTLIMAEMY
ncbi:Processing alpha glucosidase I [Quaeritorhiza haematococci]|nr:Processing alpha glucosidase I [Quaeritorhiza haematococci]